MLSEQQHSGSVQIRPIYRSIISYSEKVALIDDNGQYTYRDLFAASINLAEKLLKIRVNNSLSGERIAFLCNPDVYYIVAQWSCWLNDSICVPLCQDHPVNVLEYYVEDSKASMLMATENFETKLRPIAEKFQIPFVTISLEDLKKVIINSEISNGMGDIFSSSTNDALMIYTSGTTGRPKVSI